MIFSYSTNAFKNNSLLESLEMIAGIGFKGVEIMCDKPHLYPPDADEKTLLKIKEKIEALNLKISNLNCFTLFAVDDTYLPSWIEKSEARRQTRVDHTLNCIRLSHFLGGKNISIPPGGPLEESDRKEATSLFHKGLEKVIPLAQELDIQLLIEPEPELLIENSNQISSFVNDVASDHVGINFDVGHFYCVNEQPEKAFETLFKKIRHVHIEDIAASREHEHLIPGLGAIDFDAFFKKAAALGYTGDICVELYPYIDRPVMAGTQSYDHLSPVMEKYGFKV
jgi:sugar phosphate isomerase/epimerase